MLPGLWTNAGIDFKIKILTALHIGSQSREPSSEGMEANLGSRDQIAEREANYETLILFEQ